MIHGWIQDSDLGRKGQVADWRAKNGNAAGGVSECQTKLHGNFCTVHCSLIPDLEYRCPVWQSCILPVWVLNCRELSQYRFLGRVTIEIVYITEAHRVGIVFMQLLASWWHVPFNKLIAVLLPRSNPSTNKSFRWSSNLSKAHVTRDSSGHATWAIVHRCNRIIMRFKGVPKFETSVWKTSWI